MTSIIDASSLDEPVVIVTRMFDAPRTLVWDVITDPKHVVHWYGGPGFTNPVCEMDLRPGGIWRHVMQAPNGAQFTINSVFLEVVEPERRVWKTIKDENRKPAPPRRSVRLRLKSMAIRQSGRSSHASIRSPNGTSLSAWASQR